MNRPSRPLPNTGAVVLGIVFVALGIAFLLDALDVWDVRLRYVWPIVLIGLGVSILLRQARRPEGP